MSKRLSRRNIGCKDKFLSLQPMFPPKPFDDKLGTDPMAYGGFINGRRRGTREESRK